MMMGGWASFNKYSLLGGLRAAAQIVSYEIPLVLAPVGVIMLAGTLSLNGIVEHQAGWVWNWYVFQQPSRSSSSSLPRPPRATELRST